MTKFYNNLVLIAISIGSFNYGFTFGAPSAVLGIPSFLAYFGVELTGPNPDYAASMQGAIVGTFFAGKNAKLVITETQVASLARSYSPGSPTSLAGSEPWILSV